jgi:hypothetical protein
MSASHSQLNLHQQDVLKKELAKIISKQNKQKPLKDGLELVGVYQNTRSQLAIRKSVEQKEASINKKNKNAFGLA